MAEMWSRSYAKFIVSGVGNNHLTPGLNYLI